MLRFAVNLALLVGAATWIVAQDGQLHLQWGAKYIELSTATALALLAILLLCWWCVARCWFWLKYGWARRRERRLRKKQESGLMALTLTFSALAGNDLRTAQKAQRRATKLLGPQPLVLWLAAELAARRGDESAADKTYRVLTKEPAVALLGWRGLLKQSQAKDGSGKGVALALAEEALSNPLIAKQAFVHDVRIKELAQRSDWAEAVLALHSAESSGVFNKARSRRLAVVVGMMHVLSQGAGDSRVVCDGLARVYKKAADFTPVAAAYVDSLLALDERTTANKVIRTVWAISPNLDFVERFVRANESESPIARLQRFEQFALKNKEHPATQLALAQLCIAADVLGKARTHIQQAQSFRATRQGYLLLAELAQAEQAGSGVVQDHLKHALQAPGLGQWVCAACGSKHEHWSALCRACGGLAEVEWEDAGPTTLTLVG